MILPRSGLIIAKVISVLGLELIQTVILDRSCSCFLRLAPDREATACAASDGYSSAHQNVCFTCTPSVRSIASPLFSRRGERRKVCRKCAQRAGNMRGSGRSRRSRAPKQHEAVYVDDTVHLDDAELYEGEERPTVLVRGIRGSCERGVHRTLDVLAAGEGSDPQEEITGRAGAAV
jgi:predicted Fe-S protein YdhL (DUF1289 family)